MLLIKAISLIDNLLQTLIKNCLFLKLNYSQNGGALFFSASKRIAVIDSLFLLNSARFGGALYYNSSGIRCHISLLCFIIICLIMIQAINFFLIFWRFLVQSQDVFLFHGNKIINNSAQIGGAIKFEQIILNFENNIYKYNKAFVYGDKIASYPLKMKLSQETSGKYIVNQLISKY